MKRYLVFFFVILFAAWVGMKLYFIYSKIDIKPNVDPSWSSGQLVHLLPTVNHNRILIKADFTQEKVLIQFFAWRPPEPLGAIDTLEPYQVVEFKIPRTK